MNDQRPKPRYGEYAPPGWVSPVKQPDADQSKAEPSNVGSGTAAGDRSPQNHTSSPWGRGTNRAQPANAAARPRRTWDLYLTVALLAVGVYNVVSGFVGFSNLPQTLTDLYKTQGIGPYTEIDTGHSIGIGIAVTQAIVFLITVWVSYRALKRNKLAFFWPLIGFAVAMIITFVLLTIAMFSDPAFMEFVNRQVG